MAPVSDVLLTDVVDPPDAFCPDEHSTYIFGRSGDHRDVHHGLWSKAASHVHILEVAQPDVRSADITIVSQAGRRVSLRSLTALASLWQERNAATLYIDITALPNSAWAPLLRAALATHRNVQVVYAEAIEYNFTTAPTEGQLLDLSQRISGIRPIIGFASLATPRARTSFLLHCSAAKVRGFRTLSSMFSPRTSVSSR